MSISRRQCIGLLAAAPVTGAGDSALTLNNAVLTFSLWQDAGRLVRRQVHNRLAREAADLPAEDFTLELEPGGILHSSECQCRVVKADGTSIELEYSGGDGVEARVTYSLAPGKAYFRKQIRLRRVRGSGVVRLLRAELEDWRGVRREWQSMRADKVRYGSHPIYCATWWAGVEFVAAFNSYDKDGFVLASRPGATPLSPAWLPLHATVIGAARPDAAREAFLTYIEDVRRAPARIVTCYNSWWTLPKLVKQADNLTLIRELKTKLYDRYGIFFDFITTDMGWSDPKSIWQIYRAVLPRGFDDIRPIVESAGGKLGLWMSPSEIYPPVCDYDWAEKSGYAVVRQNPRQPGISVADPRYRQEIKAALQQLIREAGIKHIKYDGFIAEEVKPHHDLRSGVDSVEPLASNSLELLQASNQADPELVTEPTYLNSHANFNSPWMIQHCDSVWANAGGDYPPGLTPAPHYREAHTSAREYFIFRSLDEVWLPQNAVQHFDIVHVDEHEGFANHVAMAFARGRFFVPAYINPRHMAEDDWRVLAGLIRWAKANQELLRHTVEMPSRVELGEPYGYAHWQGTRGLIAVRNPSNENREYLLEMRRARAPEKLHDAVGYTVFPGRRGIAEGLDAGSTVRIALAPWELLYLEIVPRSDLREPVALGARWFREADGSMALAAGTGVENVRILEPGGAVRQTTVPSLSGEPLRGELTSCCVRRLEEAQWLVAFEPRPAPDLFRYPIDPDSDAMRALREEDQKAAKKPKVPSVEYQAACRVEVPGRTARAQVLLLVQFPGRTMRESTCTAQLDGREIALEQRLSGGHAGYFVAAPQNVWKDVAALESQWCWYICEVPRGAHRLEFRGAAGHASPRLGLWLWAERELRPTPAGSGLHCPEAALPQVRDRWEREGLCLKSPAA